LQTGEMFSSGSYPASLCDADVSLHRFALKNPIPTSIEGKDLILTNNHGNASSPFLKKRLTHKPGWMLLLPGGKTYSLHFENAQQFTNTSYNSEFYALGPNDNIIVSQRLTQSPDVMEINGVKSDVELSAPLTATSAHGSAHFDPNSLLFSYVVSGKQEARRKRAISVEDANNQVSRSITPNLYRCYYENCAPPVDPANIPPSRDRPENYQLWSQNSSCMQWKDNKNVVIPSSVTVNGVVTPCWVLVDVPTIEVDSLTVEGVIDFDQSTNVSAVYIVVQGGRLIAGFSPLEPFTHQLVINLRGTHSAPGKIFPGIELGSKVLGCFGGCDLHGKSHNVYKSDLASTVSTGASSITLRDAVDWVAGDEILITTTSYKSQETEKRVISSVSTDMKTLGLDSPLLYRHMGESYPINGKILNMRAEVALLTRNIKIVGEVYDQIDKQAFGARVLVGSSTAQNGDALTVMSISGWARLSNVELLRAGQEGWTESYDPRFAIAYVRTGTVSPGRPSYVIACPIHDSYSTGIGVFGASGISITDNVVHRAIHDGIRVTGSNHRVERNLVTATLFRGAYGDRFELENFDWHAAFRLEEATNLTLVNNTAAGSERIGFHVDGEACDAGMENPWWGNVAHGCLHGIHIFTGDGIAPCSMLRNFVVYKSWDYAIYHQTTTSVVIKDTIMADSTVGYLPIIFAPAALSHVYAEKFARLESVVCVGRSDHFDPVLDTMDEATDKNLIIRAKKRAAPRNPTGGKTCVMLPLFQSASNGAPFKPFNKNNKYPAIRGLLSVQGIFYFYKKLQADGTRDSIFWTNPANEDIYHPTHLANVTLSNVEEASKLRLDRPSLGKINPSDCVDMECDGMKKVLIKDVDGGFLGSPGAVISQAEFGWDDPNQLARGLGDYRIPKPMLTATDGTRIPVGDIADRKGIIRNEACKYNSDWQAYDCHGEGVKDYAMLVIESLDSDTETRRLSPVALLGGRTMDLNNGPQDHGWCAGYTCQKRISTFYTIVATGTHFDIFFTGYAPRNMRLHLLNVESPKTVRVAIWFAKPERLDVYQEQIYVHPENAYYDTVRKVWNTRRPASSTPDQYKPPIDSKVNGANYIDLTTRLLYITVVGTKPVDIKTVPMILLTIGFPAVSINDFFGEALVQNLATYLNVPSYKIRVVDVVRETSRRRRDLRYLFFIGI
uniref:G8 domain-containing protein n=1 Tax=Ciona savignyi TaxID=51511 RepID=H2YFZ9_CIOSA